VWAAARAASAPPICRFKSARTSRSCYTRVILFEAPPPCTPTRTFPTEDTWYPPSRSTRGGGFKRTRELEVSKSRPRDQLWFSSAASGRFRATTGDARTSSLAPQLSRVALEKSPPSAVAVCRAHSRGVGKRPPPSSASQVVRPPLARRAAPFASRPPSYANPRKRRSPIPHILPTKYPAQTLARNPQHP